MESVQRALRANPEYIEAVRLRATILGKLGEYDAAIEVLESLIRRGMDWADIHCELAQMQKARGRAEEARSHLYSAIRVNPGFERAKQMLEKWAA
jgi:tetratricopeptide (TPR) repeat protein